MESPRARAIENSSGNFDSPANLILIEMNSGNFDDRVTLWNNVRNLVLGCYANIMHQVIEWVFNQSLPLVRQPELGDEFRWFFSGNCYLFALIPVLATICY